MDSICRCPYCKTAFYLDDEEKGSDTVNIQINHYGTEAKEADRRPGNFAAVLVTIAMVFLLFGFSGFLRFHGQLEQILDGKMLPYEYRTVPEGEPFRQFASQLCGGEADQDQMPALAGLSLLKELTLDTEYVAALEGMSQLEHLHLKSRWTVNPGYLSGLTGLKELDFDEPWVDGELFPVLASLPVLEKVTLSVEYLYQDIGRLLELSSLRELHLIPDSFSTDTLYVRMGHFR